MNVRPATGVLRFSRSVCHLGASGKQVLRSGTNNGCFFWCPACKQNAQNGAHASLLSSWMLDEGDGMKRGQKDKAGTWTALSAAVISRLHWRFRSVLGTLQLIANTVTPLLTIAS